MEVVPAIDIRDGKCVKLYQGDYGRETIYSRDPVDVARRWVSLGAPRLHVVDLDGARRGSHGNLAILERIVSTVDVPVQSGGGVRDIEAARRLVSVGVKRVLVGTSAVEHPEMVGRMCEEFGADAIAVNLDTRDGYLAVKGWTERTDSTAIQLIDRMMGLGVVRFMYTDITRDDTLNGPNFHAIRTLAAETDAALMVAGGISSVDDLRRLAKIRVESAIIGKALYTGNINLGQAVMTVGSNDQQHCKDR